MTTAARVTRSAGSRGVNIAEVAVDRHAREPEPAWLAQARSTWLDRRSTSQCRRVIVGGDRRDLCANQVRHISVVDEDSRPIGVLSLNDLI